VEKREEIVSLEQKIDWQIARQRGQIKAMMAGAAKEALQTIEKPKPRCAHIILVTVLLKPARPGRMLVRQVHNEGCNKSHPPETKSFFSIPFLPAPNQVCRRHC
jgi:hypothetical protein